MNNNDCEYDSEYSECVCDEILAQLDELHRHSGKSASEITPRPVRFHNIPSNPSSPKPSKIGSESGGSLKGMKGSWDNLQNPKLMKSGSGVSLPKEHAVHGRIKHTVNKIRERLYATVVFDDDDRWRKSSWSFSGRTNGRTVTGNGIPLPL